MKKVGITGSNGFIGYHLISTLKLYDNEFSIVTFDRSYFDDNNNLDHFVSKCDIIVHLAALNRATDQNLIYETNLLLVEKLLNALKRKNSKAHLVMASSSQEFLDNLYGKSKNKGRLMFSNWAKSNSSCFTGLIIPNVFGPFSKPMYNSVIATFCYQIINKNKTTIDVDNDLKLIYVSELVDLIINAIREREDNHELIVQHTFKLSVSKILALLKYFYNTYFLKGIFPDFKNQFEKNLFNTFRSYIKLEEYFPKKIKINNDKRGSFVEIARHEIGGQTSFSTTETCVTRGNHFHTRKIERFAVIKGKALIQLRRIGTDKVYDFVLDGNEPSYVDMPIWFTHNIKNIGKDILYTIFWIDEPYNSEDPDTYFEKV